MSKTLAGICVALLSLILIVQIATLFVSVRPRVAINSLSARANMASDDTYYDPCYLGTCTPGAPQFPQNGSGEPCAMDENFQPLPGGGCR